jgi:predicted RNase H-like nuclease/tRNA(Leu) C34 or U34 (ribose-2'-O)-methylase TrmL
VHIGIDLAWGANGRTGLAAVDAAGALVDSASVRTDDEIDAWLAAHGPAVVVGVDAPLIVPNATGRREAEAELGRSWARFDAGAHPTNRSRPWMDPPRGLRLAERHGWSVDPDHPATEAAPVCLEVYPHPGMVGLFELGRVIPYKKGSFPDRRAGFEQLLARMESVAELRLGDSTAWASVRARFAAAERLVHLDVLEDEIDAVFCAHLAWRWAERRDSLRVYGDLAGGYIVAPPPPTHEPTPRGAGSAPVVVERAAVGVGPWEGPRPTGAQWDPELLAHGDTRNVVDGYRYWTMAAIVADLDARRHPFSVAIENWQHDLNIGSIVRTANAFAAETVHIVGRRRWNRRGAMVTDRYQHVLHHDDVAGLLAWAAERSLPVIAVDNVEGSVPIEAFDLPERCVLLFGQEGPGLTPEALAGAGAVVEIRQFGSTRSINASAAAAIVMHEWIRRWAR